jgi:hypothetical protein
VTEPEPDSTDEGGAEPSAAGAPETPEQKRARIMARLGEIIRADPPDLTSSGPVSAGGFPALPGSADEFDQEAADKLFEALGQFFELRKKERGSQDLERE